MDAGSIGAEKASATVDFGDFGAMRDGPSPQVRRPARRRAVRQRGLARHGFHGFRACRKRRRDADSLKFGYRNHTESCVIRTGGRAQHSIAD